jgi:hypothetical protein
MTYAPQTLTKLGAYWTSKGGVNLGIVGDLFHVTGYHLGRDRIYGPHGKGGEDYSVQHPRDKAGLTNAASAIDLGKVDGTYTGLQEFSRWLVKQCQSSAPGTRDIREVIYSPDGSQVQRWSGIDGNIHTGAGNGDASHRTHTHISYFRDSEYSDKVGAFAPYWHEDDVPMLDGYPISGGDGTVTMREGTRLINLITGKDVATTDYVKTSHCRYHLNEPWGGTIGRDEGYFVRHAQQAHLILDDLVESFVPREEPVPEPEPVTLLDSGLYRVP